ncbi:hypothetical protein [Streptomyces mirabilis]|uniref:hypothetical protein n=1 Tax=Streptomyces mirabilis TaxID=68239 RepID=UPI0033BBF652
MREVQRGIRQKKVAAPALVPRATDWIAGLPAADLHQRHHGNLLTPDITATTSAIDKIIVQDLAWVVSALLQLLELRRGVPAEGHLAALPAMIKYGVGSPAASYASSIGIHDRATATTLAANCPYPEPTFRQFLDWLSQLTTDEITALTDPDTARLLTRSAERRSPRATQAAILSGTGTFTCPLRGVRHNGNDAYLAQLPAGTLLDLVRDPSNGADRTPSRSSTRASSSDGSPGRSPARSPSPSTRTPHPTSTRSSPPTPARSHSRTAPTISTSTTRSP